MSDTQDKIAYVLETAYSDHAKWWEYVVLYRRLIMVMVSTFANSFTRSVMLVLLCVIILVTHLLVKPFKDPKGQNLETFTLSLLVVLSVLSVFDGTISQIAAPNLAGLPQYTHSRDAIHWVQLLSLPLPFIIIFCMSFRGIMDRMKRFYSTWQHYLQCFWCRKQERQAIQISRVDEDITYDLLPER